MVEWQRVGFVHGVMNTDNMSILGLTIDYGPYSFLDDYDLSFTPNTTDLPGRRYAFGRQPKIAHWNLACLAGSLAPLFKETDELQAILHTYDQVYGQHYNTMLGKKIGLDEVKETDEELFTQLQQMLATVKPDMTIFFQQLIGLPMDLQNAEAIGTYFKESLYHDLQPSQQESLSGFISAYITRLSANTISREESQARMRKANPRFVLRNYLLSQAIEELEKGENSLFLKLQEALKEPYADKYLEFFAKRPEWATSKAGCSMLSCSS
jgi:serine/tyrosine/threonine adenylyltransferase